MTTRDGTSIGRAAGALLGDALALLLDGARPPTVGASRIGNELLRVVFDGPAAAGAWLQTPGLVDPFLVDVAQDRDELRILVPADGKTSFDLVWTIQFAFDDNGALSTSEPGFVVAVENDELLDDFNDGVAAGLELHPRTAELRECFGALGAFDEG